ncbi:hypothetical protein QQS21_005707 [Conoideocrella luteorostrata]|uniref:Uncharacterized protein n=1 Tax=Conoideocrella luteorostrata TaxID=1105319 RepID=A0AAJ0CRX9_9HYPO|nr:hypothetical protein QQS21_005707 [Conoideocrella luteorostrata]
MQFSQILVVAFAAIAQAIPSPNSDVTPLESVATSAPLEGAGDVSAKARFSVTLCSELNFGGAAGFSGDTGVCYGVPANYNDRISSLRLDRRCTFWVDGGCRGNALILNAGNYPQIAAEFNDRISSLACQ